LDFQVLCITHIEKSENTVITQQWKILGQQKENEFILNEIKLF